MPFRFQHIPNTASWGGDTYYIQPILTVDDLDQVPDGTYTIKCVGVDDNGMSVASDRGAGGGVGGYTWQIIVTIAQGAIANVDTKGTAQIWGQTGLSTATRYPTQWRWTQDNTTLEPNIPQVELEAVVEPIELDFVGGESFGPWTSEKVLPQQVHLRIKGCASCGKDGCNGQGASTVSHANSLHFQLNLGDRYDHRGNGYVRINASAPSPWLYTPGPLTLSGGLSFRNSPNWLGFGRPWDLESANLIAAVKVDDANRYHIDVYRREVATWNGIYYTFTGAPVQTVIIENPDAPADRTLEPTTYNRVKITDNNGVRIFTYTEAAGIKTWTMSDGAGNPIESASESWNATSTVQTKTHTAYNSDNSVASVETTTSQMQAMGMTMATAETPARQITGLVTTQKTTGTGTAAQDATESRYDDTAPAGSVGRVKLRQAQGQPWERYQYDANGLLNDTVIQVGSNGPDTAAALNREIEIQRGTYPLPPQAMDIPANVNQLPGICTIERYQGVEVARTYSLAHHIVPGAGNPSYIDRTYTIRCTQPGANSNDGSNLVSSRREERSFTLGGGWSGTWPWGGWNEWGDQQWYGGTVHEAIFDFSVDHTMTMSSRDVAVADAPIGGFNPNSVSGHGVPSASLNSIVDGEHTDVTLDLHGRWTVKNTYSEPGAVLLETATVQSRNADGTPAVVAYNDGSTETFTAGTCCGPGSYTDRAGITTVYHYDTVGRRDAETRDGVRIRTVFDADGRELEVYRGPADASGNLTGAEQRISKKLYDSSGHLYESHDAMDRVTYIQDTTAVDGTRKVKTIFPDSGTRTEIFAPDGTLQGIGDAGDTAAYPRTYTYGAVAGLNLPGGGTTNARYTIETMVGGQGEDSPWTKTYIDMLGRVCRVETAAAGAAHPTTSQYNTLGQLVKTVDPDAVTMLYAYNAKGEQEVTALDMDRNGTIDYAGTDRITKTVRNVTQHSGTTVRRVTTSQWQTDNADAPAIIAQMDTTPNGLHTWSTNYGVMTDSSTFQTAGIATTTTIFPDGSTEVTTTDHGRPTSHTRKDSMGANITSQTYGYDDLYKRLTSRTDARNGTTNFTYYADDQIETVVGPDPDGDGPLERPVVHTYYDAAGRKNRETQPDDNDINYSYWPGGDLKTVSGARTYPVEYSYTSQGGMKTLTTHGVTGPAVTTWIYNLGRLAQKQYADSTGPSYTYTFGGRPKTRLWARGLTTTYETSNAGEIASIVYSDGSTPSVGYSYDRRGLRTGVTDASGTRNLTYTSDGQPVDDQYIGGMFAGITVHRGYDALNRRISLSVPAVNALAETDYGYDGASRLHTVTMGGISATYTPQPNSNLIGQIDFANGGQAVMATTKQYDFLDRLTSISTTPAGQMTPVSSSAYAYNGVGQRVEQAREDGSHWSYGYDDYGQLSRGNRLWNDGSAVAGQQYAYTFDSIGNRTATTINGRNATYTPNALNHYSQRTVPGAIDVMGQAAPGATVTVNGAATDRKNGYFYSGLDVSNETGPVYAPVTIQGSAGGQTTRQTGFKFLAKATETFVYDEDGNLKSDDQWNYAWDSENRLIAMESTVAAANAGAPKRRLEFVYDAYSWRIAKKVYSWNASSNAWSPSSEIHFIYDGCNLEAELESNNRLIRRYVWGLDFSGTLNGGGGIGGLLIETMNGDTVASNYLPVCDGGGDIVSLVKVSDGHSRAQYEYGAYGEMLRDSGQLSKINPIRWSTKYTDQETNAVYYGVRFYSAGLGQWLSRDPIGEIGGVNTYGFVSNRPLTRIDSFGFRGTPAEEILFEEYMLELQARLNGQIYVTGPNGAQVLPGRPSSVPPVDPSLSPIIRYSDDPPTVTDPRQPVITFPYPRPPSIFDPAPVVGTVPFLDPRPVVGTRPIPIIQPGRVPGSKDEIRVYHYGICGKEVYPGNLPSGTWVTTQGGLPWDRAIAITYLDRPMCICEYQVDIAPGMVVWDARPVNGLTQGQLVFSVYPPKMKQIRVIPRP